MHLKSHSQLLAKLDLSFLEWGGVGWGGTQAGGKTNWWLFVARTPSPQTQGWTCQNPWEVGAEDGCTKHQAALGLCPLWF